MGLSDMQQGPGLPDEHYIYEKKGNDVPVDQKAGTLDGVGLMAAISAAAGWGIAGIFIKSLPNISALTVVAVRLVVATMAVAPILFLSNNSISTHLNNLSNSLTWRLSSILFSCYILGTMSFKLAPVGEATLLMTTAPIFVISYRLYKRERLPRYEYLGAVFGMAGIALVMVPRFASFNSTADHRFIGDLLALSVSILFAIYALWFSSLSSRRAPDTMSVTIGTLMLGCFMAVVLSPQVLTLYKESSPHTYISLAGLGIISTAIPTFTYTVAAKRLPPLLTTGILLLEPVVAVVFSMWLLKEVPTIWVYLGVSFILVGLLLMSRSN